VECLHRNQSTNTEVTEEPNTERTAVVEDLISRARLMLAHPPPVKSMLLIGSFDHLVT